VQLWPRNYLRSGREILARSQVWIPGPGARGILKLNFLTALAGFLFSGFFRKQYSEETHSGVRTRSRCAKSLILLLDRVSWLLRSSSGLTRRESAEWGAHHPSTYGKPVPSEISRATSTSPLARSRPGITRQPSAPVEVNGRVKKGGGLGHLPPPLAVEGVHSPENPL